MTAITRPGDKDTLEGVLEDHQFRITYMVSKHTNIRLLSSIPRHMRVSGFVFNGLLFSVSTVNYVRVVS